MGIAWKVVVGLVLLLPMTAYVVGSLVAAADEPRRHDPIIVEERVSNPDKPGRSPSEGPRPTEKPSKSPGDDHSGPGGDDDPEVITPDPSDLFDDHGGDRPDDDDDDDNSGRGSGGGGGEDNSGKGSGDD